MRLFIHKFTLIIFIAGLFCTPSVRAFDLANGLMYAVPALKGTPALDGSDTDWDLSAAEGNACQRSAELR